MYRPWWDGDLVRGSTGFPVRVLQRKLGLDQTGEYDRTVEIAVRGFQWAVNLSPTGVVDEITALALGPLSDGHMPPEWWEGEDGDYAAQLDALGLDEAGLRRLQGNNGIRPTGVVDVETAWAMERAR